MGRPTESASPVSLPATRDVLSLLAACAAAPSLLRR
jgi:hypothetical protein